MDLSTKWHDTHHHRMMSICDSPLTQVALSDLDPDHPAVKFDRVWQFLSETGHIPSRTALGIDQIPFALKWIMLFEAIGAGSEKRYKIRLQGNAAARLTHGDLTDQYLDEFTRGDCYQIRHQAFEMATAQRKPIFADISVESAQNDGEFRVDVSAGIFPFLTKTHAEQIIVVVAPPLSIRKIMH